MAASSGKAVGQDCVAIWEDEARAWRNPAQCVSFWPGAADAIRPELLAMRTVGPWWDLLDAMGICLVCSREYENFLVGLSVVEGKPFVTCWPAPHPSGLAAAEDGTLWAALTRNPNQVMTFKPMKGMLDRRDIHRNNCCAPVLLPVCSTILPGCLYIHDLALVGGKLHANAVGLNVVVQILDAGGYRTLWWPRCVEKDGVPTTDRNYLQLNSIAAGETLASSYFGASTDRISARRPGHRNFPVDRRGVIFSGATREVFARGLTRPHSARLHQGQVWVDNSGYGEVGIAQDGGFTPVAKLPGWTRGLCFTGGYAIAGTSRVIPRYSCYAPGVEVEKSRCGLHILDLNTGKVLASLFWKNGNQIFALEALPREQAWGFPILAKESRKPGKTFFITHYAFDRNTM